jgi:PleD family two-component response regulator
VIEDNYFYSLQRNVTINIVITQCQADEGLNEAMKRTSQTLHAAKENSRNRVIAG